MLIQMPDRSSLVKGSGGGEAERFPAEVEMILSSMEAGRHAWAQELESSGVQGFGAPAGEERRAGLRASYRVRAELRLFRDRPGSPAWLIYVRDADPRGLGFISPHRLPLGYGGYVELVAPSGRPLSVPCTLFRCREAVPGWYEGAMSFNREQVDFSFGS
jgi:hypothetical protein